MNEIEIPLRTNGECSSIASDEESVDSGVAIDYKLLYDQEVERRQTLLKLAQKATRDYDELKLRYLDSTQTVDALRLRLEESDHELKNLQNVSEAVYHEYDSLKTRYEVESDTMAKAFNRATEWYNENKSLRRETAALRRQSALFIQKFADDDDVDIGSLARLTDQSSSVDDNLEKQHENEISSLMSKIKDLEAEVAGLNTELSKARADEFDAQEELVDLRKQVEDMEDEISTLKERVNELEGVEQRLGKVSEMVLVEVEDLEAKLKSEASRADDALSDAAEARRRHAAISRQSAIMISEASDDERLAKSLQDINELTTRLIHEREEHQSAVSQLKREMKEAICKADQRDELNLLKEKCELMEQEALEWQRKYIKSNIEAQSLQEKISNIMESTKEEPRKRESEEATEIPVPPPLPSCVPTAPPLPPTLIPPPPPPPPPSSTPNAVVTLAAMIGVSKKCMKQVDQAETTKAPAMDDLIDQIKRGGIQLKQTPKTNRSIRKSENRRQFLPNQPAKKCNPVKSDGNAIQEMKTILASMNRSRSSRLRPTSIPPSPMIEISLEPEEEKLIENESPKPMEETLAEMRVTTAEESTSSSFSTNQNTQEEGKEIVKEPSVAIASRVIFQPDEENDSLVPRVKDKIHKLNVATTGHIFGTPQRSTLEIKLGGGQVSKSSTSS